MKSATKLIVRIGIATCLIAAVTHVQQSADASDTIAPQGLLEAVSSFGDVSVGKDGHGMQFCFFLEEGSSHSTTIGVNKYGSFLSLDSGGSVGNRPAQPASMISASMELKNNRYTGKYKTIAIFEGEIILDYPQPENESFMVTTKDSSSAFLTTISSAQENSVLLVSRNDPADYERLVIYEFDQRLARQLLDCADHLFK